MKKYEWGEIRNFLTERLKKSKHILTFGTIGSCNIEHDIDVIITKKPKSPSADFYKEIHNLFDELNKYLNKKYGAKVIRLPSISYKQELLTLSKYNQGDLIIHSMIYNSYNQMKRDWNWILYKDEDLKNTLDNYNCLIGSVKDLYSKEFQKENLSEPDFILLNLYDRINSNYPEDFLIKIMNSYYGVFRKRLKIKSPVAKNKKEVREIFYKLCDTLDKRK